MIGIAVLGYGVVGSGVAQIILERQREWETVLGEPMELRSVVDINPVEGLPTSVKCSDEIKSVLTDPKVHIVAECIGGIGVAYEFTKQALESGRHVVTPNKELVAVKGDELLELARRHNVMYLYEASVGGGIPVLRPINQCLRANRLDRITGIVNGSTNYLLTQMEAEGQSFDSALKEAQRLGYAEQDPHDDVYGIDAKRKLAILAHECFGSKLGDVEQIPATGIAQIAPEDMACARVMGGKVKLIANAQLKGDRWSGWVAPAIVLKDSPLYGVDDVFNAIQLHGEYVGDCMFYGRGAGSLPTASAVMGDVLDIARHMDSPWQGYKPVYTPEFDASASAEYCYMARVINGDGYKKELLLRHLPSARLLEADSSLAVISQPVSPRTLEDLLSLAKQADIKLSAPIRILE